MQAVQPQQTPVECDAKGAWPSAEDAVASTSPAIPGQEQAASQGASEKARWPLWKLCLIALPQVGVQIIWTFLGPNSAPYMQRLGAGASLATLNNVAGPITGFFTGPIVGATSDSSTSRFGRRRPIILVGLISTWGAAMLYALADRILPEDQAVYLAAPMAWVMDVTVNILQTPHRALVADLASEQQQLPMQVVFVVYISVGAFMGFSIDQIYDVPIDHMFELLFGICAFNTALVMFQFFLAKEERHCSSEEPSERCAACQPMRTVAQAFCSSPRVLYHLALVQALLFIGATAWSTYSGQWMDILVFQGDQHAPEGSEAYENFVAGEGYFHLGGQLRSVLQLVSSLLIIAVLLKELIPAKAVYSSSIFIGFLASIMAAWFVQHNRVWALICWIISVMPEVGAFSIPFGLLAAVNKRAELEGKPTSAALQMALLNCCITVGQQVCTCVLAAWQAVDTMENSLRACFTLAASSYLFGSFLAWFIDDSAASVRKFRPSEEGGGIEQVIESL